jgi:hypothetical protein
VGFSWQSDSESYKPLEKAPIIISSQMMSHKIVPKETRTFMAQTNPLRTGSGKIDPPREQACSQAIRLRNDTRIVRLVN